MAEKMVMKWDVKHDRAKRVIDAFLENAGYWQEREDLAFGLTDEEKVLVSEEMASMIASIRKRYKLQERLPEQKPQIEPEKAEVVIPTEKEEETLPEPVNKEKEAEKPKRVRKASAGEKKATTRKTRVKKVEKEAEQNEEI